MTKNNEVSQELGLQLIELIRTKRDGASGNQDLAARCIALMDAGADLDARDDAGMTPLMHAAGNYRRQIFNSLLARQPEIFATDNRRRNAFDHATLKKQKIAAATLETEMCRRGKNLFDNMSLEKPLAPARVPRFKPKGVTPKG